MSLVQVTISAPSTAEKGQAFTVSGTVFEGPAPLRLGPIAGATVTIYQGGTSKGTATTSGLGLYSKSISINQEGTFPLFANALGIWSNIDYITITEPEPEPEPEGWLYIENYRGYPIYLWQTPGEDYGYWFAHEGVQWGPYATLQECRAAIDGIVEPEPEPGWEYHSTYRGIDIQVWMPDGTPYTAYFDGEWHMAALLSTLQAAIDDFLEPAVGIPTTLTMSAPSKAGVGEKFNVSGILYETEAGIPIPNQSINHSYNGKGLGSSITGVDGDYLKEVSVPESGVWTLKSEFPGTEGLQASRALVDAVVTDTPIAIALQIAGSIATGLVLFIYGTS